MSAPRSRSRGCRIRQGFRRASARRQTPSRWTGHRARGPTVVSILLNHLDGIVQPLSGEFAAPRTTLERLPFVEGYGVDIGLLVDAASTFGIDAVVQVDLGRRVHRHRPIHELGPMAKEVLLAALSRAGVPIPTSVQLNAPEHPALVIHAERPPLIEVEQYLRRPTRRLGSSTDPGGLMGTPSSAGIAGSSATGRTALHRRGRPSWCVLHP